MRSPLPVLFLSHGSPMQALGGTNAAKRWAELGLRLPRPRAVVAVSAHWETEQPTLSGSTRPQTIHDFGGFPDELYHLEYPVAGAPELARQLAGRLLDAGIQASVDSRRGLDHGAWVPLRHMYPDADVPVLQLSVQPRRNAAYHYELGRALSALPSEGVLVVASGHTTHNLRDLFRSGFEGPPLPYALAFRDWVEARLQPARVSELFDWSENPDGVRAHPTPEHFLPLLVALGAAGPVFVAEKVVEGFEAPPLALDSWQFQSSGQGEGAAPSW